jgi:hypothetical protein
LRRLALAAAVAGATTPALAVEIETLPDGMARARIVGLKLYHDPKEWLIDGEGESFAVHCRGPECEDPLMTIVAVPEELTSCSPGAVVDRSALDYPDAWTREATHAAAIGVTVYVATLDQGCRNRAGSPVYACTTHKGLTYWFIAPGEMCRTSARTSEALEALLNGLSAAELTEP